MKEISDAVTRVDKLKRKEQPGWGGSVNKAPKPGGWGSNYSAQEQEPAQPTQETCRRQWSNRCEGVPTNPRIE